jgi:hypothetical protein
MGLSAGCFLRHGDGVGAGLFELLVVAEDLQQVALDESADAGDRDKVEAAAGLEVIPGVAEDDVEEFAADVGREVGDDVVEVVSFNPTERVAFVDQAVRQTVDMGVLTGVVERDNVLVDHVDLTGGAATGNGNADSPVAAPQVQGGMVWVKFQMFDQHA